MKLLTVVTSKRKLCFLSLFSIFLLILNTVYNPILSFSQTTNNSSQPSSSSSSTTSAVSPTDVLKTSDSEIIKYSYNVTNADRQNPVVYKFGNPIPNNWILLIFNNISYSNNPESKTVIKIQEPYPSEKFVELTMFGNSSKRFYAAANTNQTGYVRIYENNEEGWYNDNPLTVSHAFNQGLTLTNGKRTVVDRLSLNGFTVGSITIYGKDEPGMPNPGTGGSMQLHILYGDPSKSPLYYLPMGVAIAVGGIMAFLLIVKKRKS